VSNFKAARDLAAWLGLTPKPHSSGGKQRLGKISKMGNRYIRRLLYLGASHVCVRSARLRRSRRAGENRPATTGVALKARLRRDGMMQRKPVKLVAVALANRTARTVWALLRTGENYRASPG